PIYMWGRVARSFLRLPAEGFAIATSCHADTVNDVLSMLARDLKLPAEVIRRLGVVVNIGLVGRLWPARRRFLTVNFIRPTAPTQQDEHARFGVSLLPLAIWDPITDCFLPATPEGLTELAGFLCMAPDELTTALDRRTALIVRLSQGRGVGVHALREAVDELTAAEQQATSDAASDDN